MLIPAKEIAFNKIANCVYFWIGFYFDAVSREGEVVNDTYANLASIKYLENFSILLKNWYNFKILNGILHSVWMVAVATNATIAARKVHKKSRKLEREWVRNNIMW